MKPLTDVLKGRKSGKDIVEHSPAFLAAVEAAKRAVAEAALLAHPVDGAENCLMVDASDVHVGASLQQRASPSSPWQPLGFFSKKLEAAQQRYSAFDRELWACFAGIRHFRYMLEGRRFAILQIISRSLTRYGGLWTRGLPGSAASWRTLPNTLAIYATSPGQAISSPTLCPGLLLPLFLLLQFQPGPARLSVRPPA
jgi:hypothetical protein